MIESQIFRSVVVHKLKGDITNRDAIDAKAFVQGNLDSLPATFTVLWDLREANFLRSDEDFQVMVQAIANSKDPENNRKKRAFLVSNDAHQARVGRVLSKAKAPWPWSCFMDFAQAAQWLSGEAA